MKKIDLQEQFEFPLEDGTSEEVVKSDEKEKEESDKELNKAIGATIKAAEEINGKDHNSLTEKLTLPEPMPYLNEELDLHESAAGLALASFAKTTLLPILIQTASQILIEKVIEYMDKHNIKVEDGEVKSTLTKLVSDTLQQALQSAMKQPEMQTEDMNEGIIGDVVNAAVNAYDFVAGHLGENFIMDAITGAAKLFPEEYEAKVREMNEGIARDLARLGSMGPTSLFTEDKQLDEALPKDLAHAYKHFDEINTRDRGVVYKNSNGYGNIKNINTSIDFDKSEYEEITPDEALDLKKQGRLGDARFVFDGQLVIYNNENKPLTKARRLYGRNYKLYIDNKGEVLDYSTQLPFKDFVERADKIYVPHEVAIDLEQRAERRSNPESRYYNAAVAINNPYVHDMYGQEDVFGNNTRGFGSWRNELKVDPRDRNSHSNMVSAMNDADFKIDRWTKQRNGDTPGSSEYIYHNNYITDAKEDKVKSLNDYRDSAAAIRNADANMALKKPLIAYRDLKKQLEIDNRSLVRSQSNLANAQQNGSADIITAKSDLEQAYDELKSLRRRIMELEDQIGNADLADAAEVKKYQDEVNNYTSKIANTQADIDKLLRKNKP